MYELDYIISKPLHKVRDGLLEELLLYLNGECNIKLTKHKVVLVSNALSCFILNSYKMFNRGVDRVYLTLDESSYSNTLIVNGRMLPRRISYTYTKHVLSFLYINGYIELLIGGVTDYKVKYKVGGKATYIPSEKKASYATNLKTLKDKYRDVKKQEDFLCRTNVLYLRDENKQFKTFKLTDTLKGKKDYLQRFNKWSKTYAVSCNGIFYDIQMYKVYNINTKKGGRSFMNGSIQSLPSKEREEVLIDGKTTTCYDFVSFEAGLAYSICQETIEGDAYDITLQGYDKGLLRSIAKKAMIMMLNCNSKKSAIGAINKYIKENYDIRTLYEQGKIPEEWVHTNKILECLEDKHHRILSMFYKETNYDLQQVGSLINDYIVDTLMQKHGVLTIQIHDGFIVQEDYGTLLLSVMEKGYDMIFGFTDNCLISREF